MTSDWGDKENETCSPVLELAAVRSEHGANVADRLGLSVNAFPLFRSPPARSTENMLFGELQKQCVKEN